MDTYPVARPRAKYCPSFVHAQQLTLPPDFNFCTAFCSADQKAMSEREQLSNWCETGLNCIDCTASLCLSKIKIQCIKKKLSYQIYYRYTTYEYFNIPSNLEVQIITLLSALPDANFLPSLA